MAARYPFTVEDLNFEFAKCAMKYAISLLPAGSGDSLQFVANNLNFFHRLLYSLNVDFSTDIEEIFLANFLYFSRRIFA